MSGFIRFQVVPMSISIALWLITFLAIYPHLSFARLEGNSTVQSAKMFEYSTFDHPHDFTSHSSRLSLHFAKGLRQDNSANGTDSLSASIQTITVTVTSLGIQRVSLVTVTQNQLGYITTVSAGILTIPTTTTTTTTSTTQGPLQLSTTTTTSTATNSYASTMTSNFSTTIYVTNTTIITSTMSANASTITTTFTTGAVTSTVFSNSTTTVPTTVPTTITAAPVAGLCTLPNTLMSGSTAGTAYTFSAYFYGAGVVESFKNPGNSNPSLTNIFTTWASTSTTSMESLCMSYMLRFKGSTQSIYKQFYVAYDSVSNSVACQVFPDYITTPSLMNNVVASSYYNVSFPNNACVYGYQSIGP